MNAAKTGSPEGVKMLLEADADPDTMDPRGMTALAYGIISGNIEVLNLLAPVTLQGSKQIMKMLAQSDLVIEQELQEYLRRIRMQNKTSMIYLLEKSSLYGNEQVLNFLLNKCSTKSRVTKTLSKLAGNPRVIMPKDSLENALKNVVHTDKAKPVEIVKNHCNRKQTDVRDIVKTRGIKPVMKIFDLPKDKSSKNKFKILDKVPKSEEFNYSNLIDQVLSLIKEQYSSSERRLIKYETLIKKFHAQVVHYDGQHLEDNKCPDECRQKVTCGRVRDVLYLLDEIVRKMSEEFPIYCNVIKVVVGSLKEHTKVGTIDETDVQLVLDKEYQKYFEFDSDHHKLRVKKIKEIVDGYEEDLELPEELKHFVTKDGTNNWSWTEKDNFHGYFDVTKYFITFIEQFYNAINSETLTLPKGLQLSTKFVPCEVCKNKDFKTSFYVRCFHDPECEEHAKRRVNPTYKESCDCRNFTSPCLTWSKIGVVLHLELMRMGQF